MTRVEHDWFEGLPGRRFRVALPPRLELLNANQRPHFHRRAEITRVLRRAAWAASRGLPHLERVHIIGEQAEEGSGQLVPLIQGVRRRARGSGSPG